MKTLSIKILLGIILSMCFLDGIIAQDYSYLLTVNSLEGGEQKFHVEIKTTLTSSSEQTIQQLTDQSTPFEITLESGEHEIVVTKANELGRIESKIVGILDGQNKGSASCDDNRAILKAGPKGRWAATGY